MYKKRKFVVDKFKTGLVCAAILYICENGGQALENRKIAKVVAYGVFAVCSSVIAYESALKIKEALEETLPVIGKSIKNIARNIKK